MEELFSKKRGEHFSEIFSPKGILDLFIKYQKGKI